MSYKTTFAEALSLAMSNLDEKSNAPESIDCEICGGHKELYKVSGLEICAGCLNDTRGELNCCVCECNTNLIVLENDFICEHCKKSHTCEACGDINPHVEHCVERDKFLCPECDAEEYTIEDDACNRYHSQF